MTRPKGHPKQQHYVPRVLLRGFSLGGNEQVYALDKTNSKVFKTTIRNIATEDRFYDFESPAGTISIEPALSQLESAVAPLLDRIRREGTLSFLTRSDRELVALFAMVQQQRTRNFREKIAKLNADMVEKFKELGFDPRQVANFKAFDGDDLQRFGVRAVAQAGTFVPYLMSKGWALLEAPLGTAYYLSDNPIALQNQKKFGFYGNIGLGVPGIEIYLPISRELTIGWFSESFSEEFTDAIEAARKAVILRPIERWRLEVLTAIPRQFLHAFESGDPMLVDSANVDNLNSLQVHYAERFIFSRENEFDLALQILEERPGLRRGPRGQVD